MVAVEATEAEVAERSRTAAEVESRRSTAPARRLSGDARRGRGVAGALRAQGTQDQAARGQPRLPLRAMDADARRSSHAAGPGLTFHEPEIPIVLQPHRRPADPAELATPDYWARQVRGTVRFTRAYCCSTRTGSARYLEIGPAGVLTALARECLPDAEPGLVLTALPTPGRPSVRLTTALARLRLAGTPWDAAAVFPGGRRTALPTYAFHTRRYWLPTPAAGGGSLGHPLLHTAVELGRTRRHVFTGQVALATTRGSPTTPSRGWCCCPAPPCWNWCSGPARRSAAHRSRSCRPRGRWWYPTTGPVHLQLLVTRAGRGRRARAWNCTRVPRAAAVDVPRHRRCRPGGGRRGRGDAGLATAGCRRGGPAGGYDRLAAQGHEYGPAFRGLRRMWRPARCTTPR